LRRLADSRWGAGATTLRAATLALVHSTVECIDWECTASQIETPICSATQLISSSDGYKRSAELWADHRWKATGLGSTTRLRTFIRDIGTHPPGMALPRTAWVRHKSFRTEIGRFRSCLHKLGMVSFAFCECGAEEQTVDHFVLQCPIHQPPNGAHGLTVLDEKTIQWPLNKI